MKFIAIISVCLGMISSCLAAPSQFSNAIFQPDSARQLNFDFNKPNPAPLARDGNPEAIQQSNGSIPAFQNIPVPTGSSFYFGEPSNGPAPGPQITLQATERSFDFPNGPTPGSQIASQPSGKSLDFQQLGIVPIKDFTGDFNILSLPKENVDVLSSLKDNPQLSAILKGDVNFIKTPNGDLNALPLPKSEANILLLPNEDYRFSDNNLPLPKGNAAFLGQPKNDANSLPLLKGGADFFSFSKGNIDISALFKGDDNVLPILKGNADFFSLPRGDANSLPLPKGNLNFPPFLTGYADFSSLPFPKDNAYFPTLPKGNANFSPQTKVDLNSLPFPKGNNNFPPFAKENSDFSPLPKGDKNSQPLLKSNASFPLFAKGNADIFSLPKSDTKLSSLPEGDANFLSSLKGNPDFMASLLKMVVNPFLLPKGGASGLSLPKGNDNFLALFNKDAKLPIIPNSDNLPGAPPQGFRGPATEQRYAVVPLQGFPGPAPEQLNAAPLPKQVKDTPEIVAAHEAYLRTVAEIASKLSEPVKDTPEVMAARETHLRIAANPEAAIPMEAPKYTPEVQAAREAHFRAYALAAKLAIESDLNPKILEQLLGRPGEPKLGPHKIEEIFASLMKSTTFVEELKRQIGMLNVPMNIQVPALNMQPPRESLPGPTDSRGIINLMEKPQLKSPIKPAAVILDPGVPQPSASLRIPYAKLSSIDEFEQSKLKAASDLICSTDLKVKDLNNIKPTEERRFIVIRTGELAPITSTLSLPIDQSTRWKNWGIQYMSV